MKRIIVEFLVEEKDLDESRKLFCKNKPNVSDAVVFADELQESAYEQGCLYGNFNVLSVEEFEQKW